MVYVDVAHFQSSILFGKFSVLDSNFRALLSLNGHLAISGDILTEIVCKFRTVRIGTDEQALGVRRQAGKQIAENLKEAYDKCVNDLFGKLTKKDKEVIKKTAEMIAASEALKNIVKL